MEKCNGCNISNDKTFPFVAISNIYEKYLFYKRFVCFLMAINIIFITILTYLGYSLYNDYRYCKTTKAEIVSDINIDEEDKDNSNYQTKYYKRRLKCRRKRL